MALDSGTSAVLRLSVRAADARVELAAGTVLRRCTGALGLTHTPIPVPVETWIETPLGYRFGLVEESELGPGVMGLARPLTGEILIAQSLAEHEERYRFTCAHELGHLILHTSHKEAFRDQDVPDSSATSDVEREADRFAAAFLMPVSTLSAELEAVRIAHGLSGDINRMLRGDDVLAVWLWRRCYIPALAERYQVSRPAMVYRCRELRLPGQRRLVKPSLVPLLVAPESVVAELKLDSIRIERGFPVV